MQIGCFALVDPFRPLDHQLARIAGMGFRCADVTDNHSGGLLSREFGFAATVSLDDNPRDVLRLFAAHGLTISSVCAHANLLDPSAPGRYGNAELMKAVRLAVGLGVRDVITTEAEPHSDWGRGLTADEQVLIVAEKLHEPLRLAGDLGVRLLLEPHGPVTGSIGRMQRLLDRLGAPAHLGINLDTGNSWLGGADPVAYARAFAPRIHHVHWKDMPREWEARRGTMFGCGMGPVALGDGVIDLRGIWEVVRTCPDLQHCTLEVAGEENLRRSRDYLMALGVG